jgi:hypothetical protein
MSSLPKNRKKDMVHSSSELCTFLFQYCPDRHHSTWPVYIDQEQSYPQCRCLDFETLQIGCLAFSTREFPPPFRVATGVVHACNIISMDLFGLQLLPSRLSNRENTEA